MTLANSFQITISAVDNVTATVKKIDAGIRSMFAPATQLGASIKGLGDALGVREVGTALTDVGRAASDVARNVGSIAAPFAAVFSAGSVAGIAAATDEWVHLGGALTRASAATGESAEQLQALGGAARLAGADAGSTTAALKSLNATMADAVAGRNNDALNLFHRLGIDIGRLGNIRAPLGALKDLADRVSAIRNPALQAKLATEALGGAGESLLPLLRLGGRGIDELMGKSRELGFVMTESQVKTARDAEAAWARLQLQGEGLANTLGSAILPALTPLVAKTSEWVTANHDLIATNVDGFARGVATAVGSIDWAAFGAGIKGAISDVKELVGWLGGWQNAAIAVAVVMNGSLIASVISLTGALGKLGIAAAGIGIKGTAAAIDLGANASTAAGAGAAGFLGLGALLGLGGIAGENGFTVQPEDFASPKYHKKNGFERALDSVLDPIFNPIRNALGLRDLGTQNAPDLYTGAAPASNSAVHVQVDFSNMPSGVTQNVQSSGPNITTGAKVEYGMPLGVMP